MLVKKQIFKQGDGSEKKKMYNNNVENTKQL